jgi:hypothetical protein
VTPQSAKANVRGFLSAPADTSGEDKEAQKARRGQKLRRPLAENKLLKSSMIEWRTSADGSSAADPRANNCEMLLSSFTVLMAASAAACHNSTADTYVQC